MNAMKAIRQDSVELACWVLFVLGLLGSAAGWVLSPAIFGASWLAALMLFLGWPVGSIGLAWVHVLTGGRWGVLLWPRLLLGIIAAPLMILAIVPLLVLAFPTYPWSHEATRESLHNLTYLNVPAFVARVGAAVVVWVFIGLLSLLVRMRFVAGLCLALLLFSVTMAAVDLNLSIDPDFNSSIYGMLIAADWTVFALAIATLGAAIDVAAPSDGLEAVGKLLLGVLILWGYLVFMQFLIVWNSDLASEAPWFVARATEGWGIAAYLLFVFHFAIPLVLLMRRSWQRSRTVLIGVSALLIASQVLRAWWLVLPSFHRGIGWVGGLAMLCLLALGAALFLRLPVLAAGLLARSGLERSLHA